MRICGRCGVSAPPEGNLCDGCGGDLRAAREVEVPPQRFVSVRLEARCADCGEFTAVPAVRVGPAAPCARCGGRAPIDERDWKKVLDRAHAVADLFGAHPEGREPSPFAIDEVNPFAAAARTRSGLVFARNEADAWAGWLHDDLRAWMAPGVPLGGDSLEPLEVFAESPGTLRVRTGGEEVRYAVDVRTVGLHRPLLGVVADEQRSDRADPDVLADPSGPRCPSCDAAFVLDGTLVLLRCESCGVVAHVPAALRLRAQADPKADTWWLAFDGPSPYRRFLERHPSTWKERFEAERPLELSPPSSGSWVSRAWSLLYLVGVPTLLLLLVGLMSRIPTWL